MRQAIAKHLAILDEAGVVERVPGGTGREVRYRLRGGALAIASAAAGATSVAREASIRQGRTSLERRRAGNVALTRCRAGARTADDAR